MRSLISVGGIMPGGGAQEDPAHGAPREPEPGREREPGREPEPVAQNDPVFLAPFAPPSEPPGTPTWPSPGPPHAPAAAAASEPESPRERRRPLTTARKWLIGAVLLGLATGITSMVANLELNVGHAVGKIVDPGASAAATGPGVTVSSSPVSGGVAVTSADGVYIAADTNSGVGCEAAGAVFPATSGVTAAMAPGTGPLRAGNSWDADYDAFGAVSAPAHLVFSVTGPSSHAIIITDLVFHVLSREPALPGVWLNKENGCGAGGNYAYGAVNFSKPAPYWIAPGQLPSYEAASPIRFPYTVTADQPLLFRVDVTADDCQCTWRADLDWTDDGRSYTAVLDDAGKPYVFTTVSGLTETVWEVAANGDWQPTS
jgi:hypothetical protein